MAASSGTAAFAEYLRTFEAAADAGALPAGAPDGDGAGTPDGAAVIVEPRRHAALRAVVANHRAMLPARWPIRLWTSRANAEWAQHEALRGLPGPLEVRALDADDLDQLSYSELLMRPAFWEAQPEELLLVFQTDCVMFRPLAGDALARWAAYDYAGANYFNAAEVAPCGVGGVMFRPLAGDALARLAAYDYAGANYFNGAEVAPCAVGGVQGGFSLRRRAAMLRCLARVGWDDVDRWRARAGAPPIAAARRFEDIYYTHACALIGAAMPPVGARAAFSVEAERPPPGVAPIAHHGWNWPYFTDAEARALIAAGAPAGPAGA